MIKVLLIDDQDDILFSVKKALENIGKYQVSTAADAVQGYRLAQLNKPDVILLDIMMPKIDGFTLNDKLKETSSTKNIPVIFLTAKDDDLSKSRAIQKAAAYIVKPVEIDRLDDTISVVLES